jgi:SAM-dependent methyltransferase
VSHIAADTPPSLKPRRLRKWLRTRFLAQTISKLPKTRDVLDLCCGYGFYFSINPNARGVDGDPACVAQLKANGYNVRLCDVLKGLPFPDNEFSYVIAHDVLEHFHYSDLQTIFVEVYRVLKPKGFFLAIQPNLRGYNYGIRINVGHRLFVTREHILQLSGDSFRLIRQYAEPLSGPLGEFFTHNKEVYWLAKNN